MAADTHTTTTMLMFLLQLLFKPQLEIHTELPVLTATVPLRLPPETATELLRLLQSMTMEHPKLLLLPTTNPKLQDLSQSLSQFQLDLDPSLSLLDPNLPITDHLPHAVRLHLSLLTMLPDLHLSSPTTLLRTLLNTNPGLLHQSLNTRDQLPQLPNLNTTNLRDLLLLHRRSLSTSLSLLMLLPSPLTSQDLLLLNPLTGPTLHINLLLLLFLRSKPMLQ